METWLIYALLATVIGGSSLVFAKLGMGEANEHVALVIRTAVLFMTVLVNAWFGGGFKNVQNIPQRPLMWFAIAGFTTAVYWILYFKAIKIAPVSTVAMVDRMGIVFTVILSFLILKEPITPRFLLGGVFIIIGSLILTWK